MKTNPIVEALDARYPAFVSTTALVGILFPDAASRPSDPEAAVRARIVRARASGHEIEHRRGEGWRYNRGWICTHCGSEIERPDSLEVDGEEWLCDECEYDRQDEERRKAFR